MGWFKKTEQKADSVGKDFYDLSTQRKMSPDQGRYNLDSQSSFYTHKYNNQPSFHLQSNS